MTSQLLQQQKESYLVSKNITVLGKRTTVKLEPEMWDALYEVVKREKSSLKDIATLVALRKNEIMTFTSAMRVFLLLYFRMACTEAGHIKAGHGQVEFMLRRAGISKEMLKKRSE